MANNIPNQGQDMFLALSRLDTGAWKIKADWKSLGLSSGLAKRSGWLRVTKELDAHRDQIITNLLWTSDRDTHQPLDGPAHSLYLDEQGSLLHHARSVLRMHTRWPPKDGANAKELYQEAVDVAKALHKAVVLDQRARLMPDSIPCVEPPQDSQPARRPKGP